MDGHCLELDGVEQLSKVLPVVVQLGRLREDLTLTEVNDSTCTRFEVVSFEEGTELVEVKAVAHVVEQRVHQNEVLAQVLAIEDQLLEDVLKGLVVLQTFVDEGEPEGSFQFALCVSFLLSHFDALCHAFESQVQLPVLKHHDTLLQGIAPDSVDSSLAEVLPQLLLHVELPQIVVAERMQLSLSSLSVAKRARKKSQMVQSSLLFFV